MKKLDIFLTILIYIINIYNIIMGIIYIPKPYAYFQLSVGIVMIVIFIILPIQFRKIMKRHEEYFRKVREELEKWGMSKND